MAVKTRDSLREPAVTKSDPLCRFAGVLLLFLLVCYSIQLFTPLRLNNDAVVLLSMGDSAAQGKGFLNDGHKTVFPPGYPALLAVLLRAGFAHRWVIVGLNIVFLSLGLFATYSVLMREFFKDRTAALLICVFFLLSWVVIKHSTIPLTDVPFFCFSMSAVAVMSRARDSDSNRSLAAALGVGGLLVLVAMTIRTIGAALLPPLLFMVVSSPQSVSRLKSFSLRTKLVIGAGAALVCGVAALMLAKTPYWRFFIGGTKADVSGLILQTLSSRLRELGEGFGNFSGFRLPKELQVVAPWIGFFLLLLVLIGAATRRKKIGASEVFVVCYMGVLAVWPFYDARYLLPVMPFFAAYALRAVKRVRLPKSLLTLYCITYAVLGFGAIAYSTWITFAGSKFPDRYGDGTLRPTYCAAFQSCQDGGDPDKVNQKVVQLIREYR